MGLNYGWVLNYGSYSYSLNYRARLTITATIGVLGLARPGG